MNHLHNASRHPPAASGQPKVFEANARELPKAAASRAILRIPSSAQKLGVGVSTLYTLIKAGRIDPPLRLSTRLVGYREDYLDHWIETRVSTGTSQHTQAVQSK